MQIHKLLLGPLAGNYLPFALARLRALERIHGSAGYFSERQIIGDYRIEVRQVPPVQFLRIEQTGGLRYEFFTSEHVSDVTLATPGAENLPGGGPFGGPGCFVQGSATRATFTNRGAAVSASPRWSSSFEAPNKEWAFLPINAPQSKDMRLITYPAWQDQKFFEHTWHSNNDGKSLVTSCQAQAPGLASGMCNWLSPYTGTRIVTASRNSDYYFDVKPTLYTKTGTLQAAPQTDSQYAWWRRAAVYSGKDGSGSFFIATDNQGRFYVYPVKDYISTEYVVPPDKYQMFTPPYPGWVTLPNSSDFKSQLNQWLWRFNKDATKCVSVPYHSEFSTDWYKSFYGGSWIGSLQPSDLPHLDSSVTAVPAREDTPGLVEFGIQITRIGPEDMDFRVEFTLLRNEYFEANYRYFFDAAYFMKDVENIGIAEDTLMTAEVEALYPAGFYAAELYADSSQGGGSGVQAYDAVEGAEGYITLNSNNAGLVATEHVRFHILSHGGSFPTLSGSAAAGSYNWGGIGEYIPFAGHGPVYVGSAGPGPSHWPGTTNPFPPHALGPYGERFGGWFGLLFCLELSTLSAVYQEYNNTTTYNQLFTRALAYGKDFYVEGPLKLSDAFLPPGTWPTPDTKIPSVRSYNVLREFAVATNVGSGFSCHPDGHWALSVAGELMPGPLPNPNDPGRAHELDWISVVTGKDKDTGLPTRKRYRHKDLFNSAFGQSRDYPFYQEAYPGRYLWDEGSFRTAGFWITFR